MSNVIDEIDGLEPIPELVSVMSQSRPVMLALDVGTSGVRASLFDEMGSEVNGTNVRINSHLWSLAGSGHVDADLLVEDVAGCIDTLLAKLQAPLGRIDLIAVSCFWHSLVGVDNSGHATTPVFGWSDSTAAAAAYRLRSQLDEQSIHARTGCRLHPSYWPAKLERLRSEEPAAFQRTHRWLSFADYLALQFYGEAATSVSMASGTGLLNIHTCEWDQELLAALRVNVESLPEIAEQRQGFRLLSENYAIRWPQISEALMLPAIGDGAANNIGAGCLSTERLALMIGTSGAMRALFNGDPPVKLPSELWCYRADRSRVLIGGALSDGGGLFNWLRESFFPGDDAEIIESELADLEPDGHGLTILPFWAGERSTGWRPDAHGEIFGLTLQTRPIEILRAAMEAIGYRFALIAKALDSFAPQAAITASGHALRSSPCWMQILADVLGQEIAISELPEASTRGAALLALEAVGKIPDIESFSVPVERIVEPNMSRHAVYQAGLQRQQQMYEKVFPKN